MKLWEKFKLAEKKKDYKTVYHGFDFVMGCTTAAQICAETYGHGGTMHANKEGMEMAIEQWGKLFYTSALLIIQTEVLQA